jgi:cell division protein FtsI/penicillin-binding protein 2
MRYVVTNGTGYKAETTSHKSAGKTATAQTGQYEDGVELLNTWFAGLYPYDNPKYAIVIMTEKGTSGSENCCPIFSTIVEKLETL